MWPIVTPCNGHQEEGQKYQLEAQEWRRWALYYREGRDENWERYQAACDRSVRYIVFYTLVCCVLVVIAAMGWLA